MKLKLTNFRCYTDQTFEFEDMGLILISAESGHGKTTILKSTLSVASVFAKL